MNKKKVLILIALFTITTITIVSVIQLFSNHDKDDISLLTQKSIVNTFENKGVSIKKDKEISPKDYELEGVKPRIYKLNDYSGILLVYEFETIGERIKIISDSKADDFKPYRRTYTAKNMFLVFTASDIDDFVYDDYLLWAESFGLVKDIVFEDLNEGKTLIYSGDSKSWKGTYKIEYYEYFWKDESATLRIESQYDSSKDIQYKLEDIDAVGPIEFSYDTLNGTSGKSTGNSLNKDGSANFGQGSGSHQLTKENVEITYVIKWNDEEETIVLTVGDK